MAKIDFEDFLAWAYSRPKQEGKPGSLDFDEYLKERGLVFNHGTRKFESIEPKPEYYKCIKEYRGFTVGKVYKTNEYGDLPSDPENPFVIMIENPCFKEYFRPATPEEIPHEDYHWNGKIDKKEATGVLKEMLDNIDEESLAKTREEMTKESSDGELTELELHFGQFVYGDAWGKREIDDKEKTFVKLCIRDIILPAARKQLQPEIDAEIEKAYKSQDEVQYKNGYNKAVDDASDWLYKLYDKQGYLDIADLDDIKKQLKENNYGNN